MFVLPWCPAGSVLSMPKSMLKSKSSKSESKASKAAAAATKVRHRGREGET